MKLFFLLAGFLLSAQLIAQKTVTGTVTGDDGSPLSDVSVMVKGTQTGTITNVNGKYTISVPAGSNTLVFSSVGRTDKESVIPASGTLNITLAAASASMDEVIIVGYGTVKKGDFTGSANQVNHEDFKNRAILNPLNAIVATGPGVQTTASGGSPGASPGIRIRGFGSLGASDGPLYVVDGVAYDAGIANLNAEDIESITTLKDAATTALWGSRASNGVIAITTRKGKKNSNNMSVKVLQGMSNRAIPEYSRVDAFQYYPLMWESLKYSLMYPKSGTGQSEAVASQNATNQIKSQLGYNPFKGIANNDIVRPDGTLNPAAELLWADDLDWMKELERTGSRSEYALSYSGGNDKSDYFGSFGYIDEKGFIIRSDWRRFTGRLSANTNPVKFFKTGINIAAVVNNSNQATDGSSTGYVNPFFFTRTMGPIYPVYAHDQTTGAYLLDAQGNRFYDYGNLSGSGFGIPNRASKASPGRHITEETKLNQELFKRNTISARAYGTVIFTDWLNFTTNISTDITDYNESTYQNTKVGDGAPAGRASKANQKTISYTFNQLLNFNKRFNTHNWSAVLGHENYDYTYSSLSGGRQEQVLQGSVEFPNFAVINSLSSGTSEYKIESYFGRINYDYDGKYFISANARRDGNSRFSKGVRWSDFYGVGLAWRVDKESFLQNVDWINSLKLRTSYGQLGNDAVGTYYAYQGLYGLGYNNAMEAGALQTQLPNPGLTWESSNSFDVGADFTLFNRIRGTVEWYHRDINKLILDVSTPLSTGGWNIPTNIGNMTNSGIEVDIAGDIIKKRDFVWELKVNASTLLNRITKLPEANKEIIDGTKKWMEGRSRYDFWLREWYGVDPTDGAALYRAKDGQGAEVRLIKNDKGTTDSVTTDINNAEYHYAGTAIPKLFGGINNSFRFKSFTFSFLLQYQLGGKVYDGTYASLMHAGDYGYALHEDALNRWQQPGDKTNVPRLQNSATGIFDASSDRWLIDASFLNVRSIALSYNLPGSFVSRISASSATVFMGAENVYLFSKRTGTNINQSFAGTTSNSYTPARIITAGINLNF